MNGYWQGCHVSLSRYIDSKRREHHDIILLASLATQVDYLRKRGVDAINCLPGLKPSNCFKFY